jgi:uncharacterized protein YjbI with pentapeptide repeats
MKRASMIIALGIFISSFASCKEIPKKDKLEDLLSEGKDVFYDGVTFDQDIDFTRFEKNLVSEGVYQVRIASSVTFRNCIFKGKVLTYSKDQENVITLTSFQSNLSFIACTFHEASSFRASSVLGRADFTNSVFLKPVSFEECTFFQNAYFRATAYHEELRFHNSVFMQKANFLDAEFDATASFQQAVFNGEAQFSSAKFRGYADFGLIRSGGNFFLNYAEFTDRAVFNNGVYFGSADFNDVHFRHTEMMNCRFMSQVRMNKSTADEKLILDKCFFLEGLPDLSSFGQESLSLEGIR